MVSVIAVIAVTSRAIRVVVVLTDVRLVAVIIQFATEQAHHLRIRIHRIHAPMVVNSLHLM